MKDKPLVSIILPTYNNERYLEKSVQSILDQTYSNFELIIINDCSTDNSNIILDSFTDSRIRIINNEINQGLVKSLNIGLEEAKGKYIARMDGDDYCLPNRLQLEVEFLENNEDVVLIGGSHLSGDIDTTNLKKQYFPTTENDIKATFLFNCPFSHITIMLRSSIINQHKLKYEESFKYAEDYALWLEISKYGKVCNLPYFLAKYRVNLLGQTSVANAKIDERFQIISKIQSAAFERLGFELTEKEKKIIFELSESQRLKKINLREDYIKNIFILFNKIIDNNKQTKYTTLYALNRIFGVILIKILAFKRSELSKKDIIKIVSSKYFYFGISMLLEQRLTIKEK